MTWLELIMFLSERNETILEHRVNEVLTVNKEAKTEHRYYRVNGLFTRDNEDGSLDTVYGRGGAQYVWRKRVELEEVVIPPMDNVVVNDEVFQTTG